MILEKLISHSVPTLRPTDSVDDALRLMDESKLKHLPLVQDDQLKMILSESLLLEVNNYGLLSEFETVENPITLDLNSHPYDALKYLQQHQIEIAPIVDADKHYIGSVSTDTVINYLTEQLGVSQTGAIIVLEIAPLNYSLAEIARIAEYEDVVILSSLHYNNKLTGKIELTLKTNRLELRALAASFERYNYTILHLFGSSSKSEDLQDRYQMLMNYINM